MLKGSIDKNLEVKITLTLEDIEKLERERYIHGIMSKPVAAKEKDDEDERDYDRRSIIVPRRRKNPDYLKLKPGESLFTAHLREFFRFEGLPFNTHYWNRNAYDISLHPLCLKQLKEGQSIVKREPNVPVNYLSVSLEQAVQKPAEPVQQPVPEHAPPAQTQSL